MKKLTILATSLLALALGLRFLPQPQALAQAANYYINATFHPSATAAGLAVECTTLPSSPSNGAVACDSADSNQVKVRSNGAWVTAGGGGGASLTTSQQGYMFPLEMSADTNGTNTAISNETLFWQIVSQYNITVAKVFIYQSANGVGASTGMAIGIYDAGGNLLQQSDTLDPTTGGAVRKTFTMASALAMSANTVYYVGFSCSCTTSVGLYQAVGNSTVKRLLLNWDTNPRIFNANNSTGTSTITMPATIGTRSSVNEYPIGMMFVP